MGDGKGTGDSVDRFSNKAAAALHPVLKNRDATAPIRNAMCCSGRIDNYRICSIYDFEEKRKRENRHGASRKTEAIEFMSTRFRFLYIICWARQTNC